ncbi:putative RPN5-26S proteasome regulatory subunit [Tilletiaria anomala UBC 951]|uniref:Putative RPN5-26S proteasome regulatory subunit n=1 Tax=Tilletiaria anomala (strain ATCC 24038 / CBS 436.72 / UBC 951) TaxID=1037660 RepID=A0A066W0T9_TILAU|nr:putative RPN5-26S proteasome regulatory subunit [Tilletiaria anomala UBC 951]KDN44380.1 putative RPN5-26S proteasome regulatory subunit [Tilletiaria anomala UBC 951]
MSGSAPEKKQEADYTNEVDELTPVVRSAATSGKLADALEQVGVFEKKARNAADLASTTRLLLLSLLLIRETPSTASTDWSLLCETIVSLSKKHGQLKQATTKMVQLAMCFLRSPGQQDVTSGSMQEEEEDVKMAGDESQEPGEGAKDDKEKERATVQKEEDKMDREGQEAKAVTKLMEEGRQIGDVGLSQEDRMKLVETLRTVTEGKIFVEVERARVTRMLSDMLYAKGDVNKAADVLQELAVETFGSMDRREKTEFILEQMRLNLERGDYARMNIVSRKINTKFFDDTNQQYLKLSYYDLMIRYALHEKKHLDVCKYHREIYNTPRIKASEQKAADVLRNVVIFLILSPYDNEQSDLIARVELMDDLDKVQEHKNLLKCFTTAELMRWPGIEALYGPLLRNSAAFAPDADGNARWEDLHKRVVEHNIRVVSKYYTRITLARLAQLLDLPQAQAEQSLADLVSSKTVYAKIDRPAGIVDFETKQQDEDRLNVWANDLGRLLDLVERTSHVIGKELAIHRAGLVVKD